MLCVAYMIGGPSTSAWHRVWVITRSTSKFSQLCSVYTRVPQRLETMIIEVARMLDQHGNVWDASEFVGTEFGVGRTHGIVSDAQFGTTRMIFSSGTHPCCVGLAVTMWIPCQFRANVHSVLSTIMHMLRRSVGVLLNGVDRYGQDWIFFDMRDERVEGNYGTEAV